MHKNNIVNNIVCIVNNLIIINFDLPRKQYYAHCKHYYNIHSIIYISNNIVYNFVVYIEIV